MTASAVRFSNWNRIQEKISRFRSLIGFSQVVLGSSDLLLAERASSSYMRLRPDTCCWDARQTPFKKLQFAVSVLMSKLNRVCRASLRLNVFSSKPSVWLKIRNGVILYKIYLPKMSSLDPLNTALLCDFTVGNKWKCVFKLTFDRLVSDMCAEVQRSCIHFGCESPEMSSPMAELSVICGNINRVYFQPSLVLRSSYLRTSRIVTDANCQWFTNSKTTPVKYGEGFKLTT